MTEERDPELSSIVAEWAAPSPDSRFQSRVLLSFSREFGQVSRWQRWIIAFPGARGLLGGAVIGVLLLCVVTLAFPQTFRLASPWFRIPFTVETQSIVYSDKDGSEVRDNSLYETFTSRDGVEIVLTETSPGDPGKTFVRRIIDAGSFLVVQIAPSLILPARSSAAYAYRTEFIKNGCIDKYDGIDGRETILGHPVVRVVKAASPWSTFKAWYAPDLDCFMLKYTTEERRPRPDGTLRMYFKREALKIDVNP